MAFKILISIRAQLKIEEITDFYFDVSLKVLKHFNERLEETFSNLIINPCFQKRYKDFHGIPLKQFPFILFYKNDDVNKLIKIYSCFHTSQDAIKYPH